MTETEMQEDKTPLVYQQMHKAQASIKQVGKGGKNSQQGYSFRTIDDVLARCKVAFDKFGLLFTPVNQEIVKHSVEDGGKSKIIRCVLKTTWCIVSAEDGSFFQIQSVGEGVDYNGDKAAYKAMTGSQKYALTQAFNLPCEGADPEAFKVQEPESPLTAKRKA